MLDDVNTWLHGYFCKAYQWPVRLHLSFLPSEHLLMCVCMFACTSVGFQRASMAMANAQGTDRLQPWSKQTCTAWGIALSVRRLVLVSPSSSLSVVWPLAERYKYKRKLNKFKQHPGDCLNAKPVRQCNIPATKAQVQCTVRNTCQRSCHMLKWAHNQTLPQVLWQ